MHHAAKPSASFRFTKRPQEIEPLDDMDPRERDDLRNLFGGGAVEKLPREKVGFERDEGDFIDLDFGVGPGKSVEGGILCMPTSAPASASQAGSCSGSAVGEARLDATSPNPVTSNDTASRDASADIAVEKVSRVTSSDAKDLFSPVHVSRSGSS